MFEQRLYPPPDTMMLGLRFSSLIWWLEPLLLIIACVLWGGLLAEFVEIPAAAALKRRFGPRAGSALDRSEGLTPS